MLPVLGACLLVPLPFDGGDLVEVRTDDTEVRSSCTLTFPAAELADEGAPGVVRILGNGITVRFRDPLAGPSHVPPNQRTGIGIVVLGQDVRLVGPRVSGFRIGILGEGCDDLEIVKAEVTDGFRQHLGSTPLREDPADWLWPHDNDAGEWGDRYGAAVLLRDARNVTVRDSRARRCQNGLVLERVHQGRVYDNDFSFLSGWGIALWRSSDNRIHRNAVDFCVRGYSHGVYNRGQDSAGLLLFEQCSRNSIVENSALCCGDGFFGFAGKDALGERPATADLDKTRAGNNDNWLLRNDFSYAAAHGLEMTFSFGNRFLENRLVGNAICGIWAGYSKDTWIAGNRIEKNGDMAYGLERGGIDIEHGSRNRIVGNAFEANACGIRLWWDPDEGLAKLPWVEANGAECGSTLVAGNAFHRDSVALEVVNCPGVRWGRNALEGVARVLAVDGTPPDAVPQDAPLPTVPRPEDLEVLGSRRPVGARPHLASRARIRMTEWGPWDHETPAFQRLGQDARGRRGTRVLVPEGAEVRLAVEGPVRLETEEDPAGPTAWISPRTPGRAVRYRLTARTGGRTLELTDFLVPLSWTVTVFPWTTDPRTNPEAWLEQASDGVTFETPSLELAFGNGGPSDLEGVPDAVREAGLARDRFGTLARCRVQLPPGRYAVRTRSDDGIRVRFDGRVVIDDWTWHPPKNHRVEVDVPTAGPVDIEVHHFELDGYAVLSLDLVPLH